MLTRNRVSTIWVAVVLSFFLFLIYWFTSAGTAPHDYFLRLGRAMIEGRWWLTEHPSWLNELIPSGDRFYVVYPPMPAILHVPFLLLFGGRFEQQWLAHLIGVGVAVLTGYLGWITTKKRLVSLWGFLLAGLGTINWYHAATGSVWLLGQLTAEFFLLAALCEALGKKRVLLVGLLFGAAYWSRLQTVVSLPVFIYLLRDRLMKIERRRLQLKWRQFFFFLVPILAFVGINWVYNFIRFGTILDVAYLKIPGVLSEPWFRYGLFNFRYIPEHLEIMFLQMPTKLSSFPYLQPSWAGLAIWITTPAFFYALLADRKEKLVRLLWAAVLSIALVNFSHGSTGFAQFGYRFAMDFYPFLFLLTLKGVGRNLSWGNWSVLFLGIAVNLWGVLWINKFSWVGW